MLKKFREIKSHYYALSVLKQWGNLRLDSIQILREIRFSKMSLKNLILTDLNPFNFEFFCQDKQRQDLYVHFSVGKFFREIKF